MIMIKPFTIVYSINNIIGLIIPIDTIYCQIYWSDGDFEEKVPLDLIHRVFENKSIDLSEKDVLIWRLKHGV